MIPPGIGVCWRGGREDHARLEKTAKEHWPSAVIRAFDHLTIALSHDSKYCRFLQEAQRCGCIDGYAGLVAEEILRVGKDEGTTEKFLQNMLQDGGWPLGPQWSGCFAACASDRASGAFSVGTDPVGSVPMYYRATAEAVWASSSLQFLSRLFDAEVDPVGLAEAVCPPYVTYGARTILRGVRRLLPGERIVFQLDGSNGHDFDNTLYREVLETDRNRLAAEVWRQYRKDVGLALDGETSVHVAMSGGMDSRMALAAASSGEERQALYCHTYGDARLYETKIAAKCSEITGAHFRSYSLDGRYFPDPARFRYLADQAEAPVFLVWNPILEGQECRASSQPMILGDLCESVAGRNILTYSSREARLRHALRSAAGRSETFKRADRSGFAVWKQSLQARIVSQVQATRQNLAMETGASELEDSVRGDLDESFERIEQQMPPYVELFDELFNWLHKARLLMAAQLHVLRPTFRGLCPSLGASSLRLVSRIHPRHRIRRRLMDAVAQLPDLHSLCAVPTAQSPWVAASSSPLLRDMIWGARSAADQVLIRRAMRLKKPEARRRVLASLDYVAEYQRACAEEVGGWFGERWIRKEAYIELLEKRARMDAWPMINLDIAAPASVSALLDSCVGGK